MRTVLLIVALTAACGRDKTSPPSPTPTPTATTGSAPATGTAATRPTDAQAVDAVKAWIAAIAANDAGKAGPASAIPFRLTDHFTATFNCKKCTPCTTTTASDPAALGKVTACLTAHPRVRGCFATTSASLEAGTDAPASLGGDDARDWAAFAQVDPGSHTFVSFAGSEADTPADVLYALVAVRLVDGAPKVDGAFLAYSLEGE